MNVCTDGDGTHMKVENKLMQRKADSYPWFCHIDNLPLVDKVVGKMKLQCTLIRSTWLKGFGVCF